MNARSHEPAWVPPQQFAEYRIIKALGAGAMGQVYLAMDTLLDRAVALKFIAMVNPTPTAKERFLVEARAAARVQHPNVVSVYRVGDLGGRPYLVSELIHGQSLDRVARPLPWRRAFEIGLDLARGLTAAHRRGVLHRDIKPANAMLGDDGVVKLVDFGLAKLLLEGEGGLTQLPAPAPRPVLAVVDLDATATAMPAGVEPTGSADPAIDPFARTNSSAPGHDVTVDSACEAPRHAHSAIAGTQVRIAARSKDLTQAGALMGTPYYMSPEAWRGEPATRCSDVYSLGVMIYELASGVAPNREVPFAELSQTVQTVDPTPLATRVPAIDRRFAAIVDRCLARDPAQRWPSAEELCGALEALVAPPTAAVPEGNPYRGLAVFDAQHRALFFGRVVEIRALVDRLRADSFVLVAGDSGVGKSSVCRAGVLPLVLDGALGARKPLLVSMVPGREPVLAFAAAMAATLERDEDELASAIRSDPAAVARDLRRAMSLDLQLVLFVDQLEELLTLAGAPDAAAMAALLGALAVPSPSVRVLATVRGDFLTRLARLPAIGEEIARALYLLRPMSGAAAREAIVGPARAANLRFESDALVDELVRSMDADGALPLLQFALAELWEHRDADAGVISARALADMGGVSGALARHADGVVAALLPAQRAAARAILVRLVTPEKTRARRNDDELGTGDPDTQAALDALIRGRLVLPRDELYEIAHEALIAEWQMLRELLHEDVDHRVVRERLARAAEEWTRLGKSREALWSARQLAEAGRVDAQTLGERDREFLTTSWQVVRRRRFLRFGTAAMMLLVVVGVYAGMRISQRVATQRRVELAVTSTEQQLAEASTRARTLDELRTRAFASFDASDLEAGERLWAEAMERTTELDQLFSRASQTIETALLFDGDNAGARHLLADATFARALLAEQRGDRAQVADLWSRIALYDSDGSRRQAWTRPASLAITTVPAGAQLELEHWVEDERGGRYVPASAGPELAPGSYRITARAAGRAPALAPILLSRGEQRTLRIELLPSVPEGFVYVPAGRFLYGSREETRYRKNFQYAPPIHDVEGAGFLIARHETTFAEWIAYLESLPPEERARRTPKTGSVTLQGSLELVAAPAGWRLELQPATVKYSAGRGEPIQYEGRTVRWEHQPVTGISWDDAVAYTEWLRSTGRVPGARLCTDFEWEQAARGADGRRFPHGDRLQPADANHEATYGRNSRAYGPDAVGSHPNSRSPYGIDDLAGNVWELTTVRGGRPEGRGGSFSTDENALSPVLHQAIEHGYRDMTLGMRVCASLPEDR